MALFDSIVAGVRERFGLSGEQSNGLLAALLGLIADPNSGGFGGFLSKFRDAGLGSQVSSWISGETNLPLSNEQVEKALGPDTIDSVAARAGIDKKTATTALGGIIPGVVDSLTPDGTVPDESSLLSKIGGFISEWGGAIGGAVAGGAAAVTGLAGSAAGAVGNAAGATADAVSDAAGATYDKGKEVLGSGINAVSGGVRNAGAAVGNVADRFDTATSSGGLGGILKWLIPLLLLALLAFLGYQFCSPGTTTTGNANVKTNTNSTNANVSHMTNANTGNANAGNANAGTEAAHTLGEVVLPNGTKLQAYPGGIEDQLVKFIGSDEYKNATPEQLKDKWFSFDDLNFVFGKTELTPESKRQLENIVTILKAYPDVKIKVGAYTDKKGDDAANLKLSDSRAKAVQAALQKAGVGSQVPEAEGYGEKFAKVDENASDEERKADRKTAIRLIKGEATSAAPEANANAHAANANAAHK